MLDPDRAKQIVLEHIAPKPPQQVGLEESLGLVLQEDIRATCSVPAFDNSAMDGYAVLASDLAQASPQSPVVLEKVDYIPAGNREEREIQSGQCYQIATGAELPPGADAVVMKERVEVEGNQIRFMHSPQVKEHLRFKGEDIEEHQTVVRRGELIGPAQIALFAAFGHARVLVQKPLEVVIITTGSELVDVNSPLEPGKIHDSNSYMFAALFREERCLCHRVGIVQDDPELLYEVLKSHINADMVLISGGVSVGDRDFVKDVLRKVGVEEIFWKVRVKPGKPFFFGKKEDSLIFGMPGNPASGYVIFEEFVRPAIRKAMGYATLEKSLVTATLEKRITERTERRQYLRAQLRKDGDHFRVKPLPVQGSHSLSSLAWSNSLIIVPENSEELPEGSQVTVRPLIDTLGMQS
ncbi:MAG: molybdopterin molybdotransferase MoeA [SAR324 cluster bacterium]|nr:molybdopterin molybdotransferase MoeA [SAR324 cluster bacterium]